MQKRFTSIIDIALFGLQNCESISGQDREKINNIVDKAITEFEKH